MTAADDLHQRGLAAAAAERFDEAAQLIGQAVEAAPAVRQFRTNLGLALGRLGRHAQAVEVYSSALALEPGHGGTLAKLGRALERAGRLGEAVSALESAALAEPDNPDTANALGAALASGKGREAAARQAFERAVALDPDFGEAWQNLGLLEARQEQWETSARAFGWAVQLQPPTGGLIYQWGVALARSGRPAEARQAYERATALDPLHVEGWNNLGHVLAALGEQEAALQAVRRALAICPNYADARYNLGVVLQSLGRSQESRRAYQLVLAGRGADADTLNNLGGLCLSDAEPLLAIPYYRRALAVNRAHPEARWNLGLAQLSTGHWEEGWQNYEARPNERQFPFPRWRGGDSLVGQRILAWCEQGLGDGIQFLRYAGTLRQLGATSIAVECPERLAPLLRLAEGIDCVVVRGQKLPDSDCHVPLMSMPAECATVESTIPAPGPAYRLPPDRTLAWQARLAGLKSGGRIGIVWGGNPVNRQGLNRSMPLEILARLASAVEDVTLVSLQHGVQREDLRGFPQIMNWPQEDLADTAALVAELDLVITVDTLMAHLAGTLGCPVWVMVPFAADWRWMTGRLDSPWYPAIRLFRQTRPGDWAGVVERVIAAVGASQRGGGLA